MVASKNQHKTPKKNNAQSSTKETYIKFRCSAIEKKTIEENAKRAGLDISPYLRLVAQNYPITEAIDLEKIKEASRISGNLGRLGGLLKCWLSDETLRKKYGVKGIHILLENLEKTREEIYKLFQKINRQPQYDIQRIISSKKKILPNDFEEEEK